MIDLYIKGFGYRFPGESPMLRIIPSPRERKNCTTVNTYMLRLEYFLKYRILEMNSAYTK